MDDYISRKAFIEQKRKLYCEDCGSRKGMRNGKYKTLYEIGEAPCRACGINDVLNDVEDFPAADVRPVVRGRWVDMGDFISCSSCNATHLKEYESDYGKVMRLDARANFCPNCGADMRPPKGG